MKRILSLALVLILVMSSLLLVACDDKTDEPAATTTAATTAAEESGNGGGATPADPVKVDDVNGMTAIELYEKFMDEYTTAETYDVKLTMDMIEDGVTEREEVIIKLGADAAYLKMDMDGGIREYWGIDGYVYYSGSFEGDTQKVKIEGELTSVLGDMIGTMLSFPVEKDDMSEAYLAEVEKAELYLYAGQYYYTVSLVETEDDKEVTTTETVYFDAQGKATKIVIESEGEKLVALINGYGKPVTVKAPADIDSFVDMDDVGGGEGGGSVDAELYELYRSVFDVIRDAESYIFGVSMHDTDQFTYITDGESEYIALYDEDDILYMWYMDDKVYSGLNDEEREEVPASDEVLSTFEMARIHKDTADSLCFNRIDVVGIEVVEETSDRISFSAFIENNGMTYNQVITYCYDNSFIYIQFVARQGTNITNIVGYSFSEINAPNFQMPMPF